MQRGCAGESGGWSASCSATRALFIYLSRLPQLRAHGADISRLPPTAGPGAGRRDLPGSHGSRHGSGSAPQGRGLALRARPAPGPGGTRGAGKRLSTPFQPLLLHRVEGPSSPQHRDEGSSSHQGRDGGPSSPQHRDEGSQLSPGMAQPPPALSWVQEQRQIIPSWLLHTCPCWGQQCPMPGPVPSQALLLSSFS